jgi:hypothetical protein
MNRRTFVKRAVGATIGATIGVTAATAEKMPQFYVMGADHGMNRNGDSFSIACVVEIERDLSRALGVPRNYFDGSRPVIASRVVAWRRLS